MKVAEELDALFAGEMTLADVLKDFATRTWPELPRQSVEDAWLGNVNDDADEDSWRTVESDSRIDPVTFQLMARARAASSHPGGVSAAVGEFCRNPLHPGPCAHWHMRRRSAHGHPRRSGPAYDARGYPVGLDVSGMEGDGWSLDDPLTAELAVRAHLAGFTSMAYHPDAIDHVAGVRRSDPGELLLDDRSAWDQARLEGVARQQGPFGPDQTMFMTGETTGSLEEYILDHEGGHHVAFVNGQDAAGYPRLRTTLVDFADEFGIMVHPVDFRHDPDTGREVWTPAEDEPGQMLSYHDLSWQYMAADVSVALARMGLSWRATQGMDELYAELYAAYQGGSDLPIVERVAQVEGWER